MEELEDWTPKVGGLRILHRRLGFFLAAGCIKAASVGEPFSNFAKINAINVLLYVT
jgi:hypothetical protein